MKIVLLELAGALFFVIIYSSENSQFTASSLKVGTIATTSRANPAR